MPFRKILIATDGSRSTEEAVRAGIELAGMAGAEVTAIFAVDGPVLLSTPVDPEMANLYALLEKEGQTAVDRVRELGSAAGVTVETKIVNGHPAKVITEESAGYDLVVVGSLGRTGMTKILVGSVAEKVVKLAKCPVMVVRNKGEGQ